MEKHKECFAKGNTCSVTLNTCSALTVIAKPENLQNTQLLKPGQGSSMSLTWWVVNVICWSPKTEQFGNKRAKLVSQINATVSFNKNTV